MRRSGWVALAAAAILGGCGDRPATGYPSGTGGDGGGEAGSGGAGGTGGTGGTGGVDVGSIALVAGNSDGPGTIDGTGRAARFGLPADLELAPAGEVLIADATGPTIRKLGPDGTVTTIAGLAGQRGHDDGPVATAKLAGPSGLALAPDGKLYIADASTVRVLADGVLSTLAGSPGKVGHVDGIGAEARFLFLKGMAFADGFLYVADTGNCTIRRVDVADGTVTTFAGSSGACEHHDGPLDEARFDNVADVAIAADGALIVADSGNVAVRRIFDGEVTTLAGTPRESGTDDGTPGKFSRPERVLVAGDAVLVADMQAGTVRKISGGVLSTIAGIPEETGTDDGPLATAQLGFPLGLAGDETGFYVADAINSSIRLVTAGAVTTVAGTAPRPGAADGTGAHAEFFGPSGIVRLADGSLLVADTSNHTIRAISPGGVVTTLAGAAGEPGNVDGTFAEARFQSPTALELGPDGKVYVGDGNNAVIRALDLAAHTVSWVAGAGPAGREGPVDGPKDEARFGFVADLAFDAHGNLLVADSSGQAIRMLTTEGEVVTVAGSGLPGFVDGAGIHAFFNFPQGVAVAADGTIWVTDTVNHAVRVIDTVGNVTTLAPVAIETGGIPGWADGTGAAARFDSPRGILLDADGTAIVVDSNNDVLRRVTAEGVVTTIAGTPFASGLVEGAYPGVLFEPQGIAFGAPGELLLTSPNAVVRVKLPGE